MVVRRIGQASYMPVLIAQRNYTRSRDANSGDEFWQIEHEPVFTLGRASRSEHLMDPGNIPVVQSDRGGQVTYHGPGQVVIYLLLDLRRIGLGVKGLIERLEQSVIDLLDRCQLVAHRCSGAPGVYVGGRKIAALGLRVSRGCTYHGLALNVAMDLEPFSRIHPCGYRELQVTDMVSEGVVCSTSRVGDSLIAILADRLGFDHWDKALPPMLTECSVMRSVNPR